MREREAEGIEDEEVVGASESGELRVRETARSKDEVTKSKMTVVAVDTVGLSLQCDALLELGHDLGQDRVLDLFQRSVLEHFNGSVSLLCMLWAVARLWDLKRGLPGALQAAQDQGAIPDPPSLAFLSRPGLGSGSPLPKPCPARTLPSGPLKAP